MCIYIHTILHTIYTTPNKKLFKFCWVHMFLPKKTHPWVIFFSRFPLQNFNPRRQMFGTCNSMEPCRSSGRGRRRFSAVFFQRPVLKLTLLGIDRVVGSVFFFNFMILLFNIDFFKYQPKINGRSKNSMSKCLLPFQDSVQAVCIIVCIICLVIRIMTSLAADC